MAWVDKFVKGEDNERKSMCMCVHVRWGEWASVQLYLNVSSPDFLISF